MRIILAIVLSWLTGTIYGQLKPEDVFYTGEHFKQDECRVETHPDWGRLVILSNDRFLSSNFNKSRHNRDTMVLVGNYRIFNDTLYLSSIKFAVQWANWTHRDTVDFENQPGYEWMKKDYPDIKFKITKCDDGQILLVGFADNRFWYARPDPGGATHVQRMKADGQWEHLLR